MGLSVRFSRTSLGTERPRRETQTCRGSGPTAPASLPCAGACSPALIPRSGRLPVSSMVRARPAQSPGTARFTGSVTMTDVATTENERWYMALTALWAARLRAAGAMVEGQQRARADVDFAAGVLGLRPGDRVL